MKKKKKPIQRTRKDNTDEIPPGKVYLINPNWEYPQQSCTVAMKAETILPIVRHK